MPFHDKRPQVKGRVCPKRENNRWCSSTKLVSVQKNKLRFYRSIFLFIFIFIYTAIIMLIFVCNSRDTNVTIAYLNNVCPVGETFICGRWPQFMYCNKIFEDNIIFIFTYPFVVEHQTLYLLEYGIETVIRYFISLYYMSSKK